MHPSFGQTNSVWTVEPICRCGVGQVLSATSILQERLAQGWRAPNGAPPPPLPPEKKWSWNQVDVARWFLQPLLGWFREQPWSLGASPPSLWDMDPACSAEDAPVVGEVCPCQSNSSSHEGPGTGWTILPAQIVYKCPTVAQDDSFSPRRLWFSWVPFLTILSKGRHGLWVDTEVRVLGIFAPWLPWAGQQGLSKELSGFCVCSSSALLWLFCCCYPKVAGLVNSVQKETRHIPLGILSVYVRNCCSIYLGFDVLGKSHSTLQRFC